MGGLGNQMFQYAAAKRLADKNGVLLRLDISSYDKAHKDDTPRQYDLACYKISGKIASKKELGAMLPQDYIATTSHKIKRRLGIVKNLRPLGEHGKAFNANVLKFIAFDSSSSLERWKPPVRPM